MPCPYQDHARTRDVVHLMNSNPSAGSFPRWVIIIDLIRIFPSPPRLVRRSKRLLDLTYCQSRIGER